MSAFTPHRMTRGNPVSEEICSFPKDDLPISLCALVDRIPITRTCCLHSYEILSGVLHIAGQDVRITFPLMDEIALRPTFHGRCHWRCRPYITSCGTCLADAAPHPAVTLARLAHLRMSSNRLRLSTSIYIFGDQQP